MEVVKDLKKRYESLRSALEGHEGRSSECHNMYSYGTEEDISKQVKEKKRETDEFTLPVESSECVHDGIALYRRRCFAGAIIVHTTNH